ncbi:hypothetical protein AVEN_109323-1 [Araneus ventricosus]|uniref:Uncharacterized protein n=1 Tax=Araneus ventricosus TaxID=182803 RepID=A0A4Y2D344_ARAVE|nr:hypothetical protein AVEN_109323-1 [Araneus ventricosus]
MSGYSSLLEIQVHHLDCRAINGDMRSSLLSKAERCNFHKIVFSRRSLREKFSIKDVLHIIPHSNIVQKPRTSEHFCSIACFRAEESPLPLALEEIGAGVGSCFEGGRNVRDQSAVADDFAVCEERPAKDLLKLMGGTLEWCGVPPRHLRVV